MRRAIITGASGGVGHATVALFAERGWEVIAVDRDLPARPHQATEFAQLDLTAPGGIEVFASKIAGRPVHALVNNAAIGADRRLEGVDRELFDSVMDINLRAPLELMRIMLPNLSEVGGAVVNVASVHAVATSANVSVYAASKGGLVAVTRAVAVELGDRGIRCNAVMPGAVDTALLHAGLDRRPHPQGAEGNRAELEKRTPLHRIGRPAEVAEAIYFLADGDRSAFITGQTLTVDGGVTARLASE